MKKIALIFFLSILSNISFSQSDYTFKKIVQLPYGGFATSVKQTLDESYIICGSYYDNSGNLAGNFLMKLLKDGTTLWYKEFAYSLYFSFNDLTFDVNGNIYISASGPITIGSTDIDIVIIKTNSSGTLLWSKAYGGASPDVSLSINLTSDNNILTSGYTQSYATAGAIATSYNIKVDLNGNLIWNKLFGDVEYNRSNYIKEIYPNKYVAIGMSSSSTSGKFSVFDNTGNLLTSKIIDYSDLVYFSSVTQFINGGYLVAGSTATFSGPSNLHPFLIALDSSYNFLWAKKYFPSISIVSEFISINQTLDGSYITSFEPEGVNGTSKSLGMMKLDDTGAVIWGRLYEQYNYYAFPYKLIVAKDNGYVEVGFIEKSSLQQPFILKTNSLGVINGCIGDTTVTSSSIDVIPTITSYGSVSSSCIVNNIALSNVFVTRSDSIYCLDSILSINGIEQHLINNEVIVYPNPVLSETTFSLSKELKKGTLNIFDVTGKKINSKNFSGMEVVFHRNQLPSGMYFYTIDSENRIIAKGKLIFRW